MLRPFELLAFFWTIMQRRAYRAQSIIFTGVFNAYWVVLVAIASVPSSWTIIT
jgi:hypothetical protein